MSNQPPSYDYATGPSGLPGSSTTTKPAPTALSSEERERLQAEGKTDQYEHQPHHPSKGDSHDLEDDSDVTTDEEMARKLSRQWNEEDREEREEMADEERELPEGYVRAYDSKSGHHFYVNTRADPPQSSWIHPYDDPDFVRSLPDTHPANPNSSQARQARSQYDQLMAAAQRKRNEREEKKDLGVGSKIKNKLTGTTHNEREAKRLEKRAKQERALEREQQRRQEFAKRRQELMKQQGLSGGNSMLYASNPYGYAAPSYPYCRSNMYGPRYGYPGYGGGYGYGMGMGPYGRGGIGMGGPLLGLGGGMLLGSLLF